MVTSMMVKAKTATDAAWGAALAADSSTTVELAEALVDRVTEIAVELDALAAEARERLDEAAFDGRRLTKLQVDYQAADQAAGSAEQALQHARGALARLRKAAREAEQARA